MQNIFEATYDYDGFAECVIPEYQVIQRRVVDRVMGSLREGCSVLDLGCGTAQTMARLLAGDGALHVTGVDGSPAMLSVAQQRLAAFAKGRWELQIQDIVQMEPLAVPVDVTVSVATLNNIPSHHIPSIYRTIYASLVPHGTFVYADFIAHESPLVHQKLETTYDAWVAEKLVSEEMLHVWRAHSDAGYYPLTLSQHIQWLEEAGFASVSVVWLQGNFAILSAERVA